MSEGKYTFHLRAQNLNGEWSETVLFPFSVLPPWHRTYWAYALYLLLFVLLVYYALRIKTRRLTYINAQLEKTIEERTSKIALQNEELRKQTDQITLQSKTLLETNAAKDKLFRIIAHDLRSPISGLMKLTDIMANESEEFSISEFAEISRSLNISADNLYKLMNNLLEWATMQQEGIQFNPEKHQLWMLIEQAIGSVSERAKQKNIIIENTISGTMTITADEKMINTVLRNLVSNAVKFTEKGGRVILSAVQNEEETEISVHDTGVGISETDIEKLFKIEEKVGRPGTDNELSTGLGLVLCKEFVEKHNGRIKVESAEGKGSTFSVAIPNRKIN
jgi:signal transduction histidine kinase